MRKRGERLSNWLMGGFLSIPPVLLTYFYLLLHLGLGLPFKDLWYPALAFCAFMPFFSTLSCWGYRSLMRGKDGVLEFRYFEMKLGIPSTGGIGFVIVWALIITMGGHYTGKWVRRARRATDSSKW